MRRAPLRFLALILLAPTLPHCGSTASEGETAAGTPGSAAGAAGTAGGAAGAAGAAGTAGGTAGGAGAGGKPVCPDSPTAVMPPAGWTRWEGSSCQCPLYVPPTPAELPAPLVWEPCGALIDVPGCQRTQETDGHVLRSAILGRNPTNGTPVLHLERDAGSKGFNASMRLVAEVSGPVRNAFYLERPTSECAGASMRFAEGDYVFDIRERSGTASEQAVLFSGTPGSLPSRQLRPPVTGKQSWDATPDLLALAEPTRASARHWDGTHAEIAYESAAGPAGSTLFFALARGKAVFLVLGSADSEGFAVAEPRSIWAWSSGAGGHALLPAQAKPGRAVLTFETDGVDMVWVEGDTSVPGKLELDWMTAPYTTDAGVAASKGHRLRSFGGRPGWPSAVGCGYAVSTSDQVASALRIVRLTDGVSWTLPGSPKHSPSVQPIGVTCDEVYGVGWYGDTASGKPIQSVVRFRLDALGPGIPPD